MSEITYAVIVPVYNSEATLEELYRRLADTFNASGRKFRVIFIDDYSKDNSAEKLKELKAKYPDHITAVSLAKNFGQHSALLCGIHFAGSDYVITMDDDLQIPPEEILKLIEMQEETCADVVYGVYKKKQHNFFRNAGSKLFELLFKYFASTPGKGSSFKIIKSNIVERISIINSPYFYLDEVISWYTDNIVFTIVEHNKRAKGKSNYSGLKLIFMSLSFIISYTILPLRIMTYTGLIASLVSLSFVIYFIYLKYYFGAEMGFTALISAIFLSTSLILFCLGIIGEYISRLYASQNNRPPYIVKRIYQ